MKQVIGVVDYGIAGNVHSIVKAIEKVGGQVSIVKNKADFIGVDKLVIPGVGSFADAMAQLHQSDMIDAIGDAVFTKKIPTLGICLGMQIFSKIGYERGDTAGLALLDAEVREIKCKGVLPHVGFSPIAVQKQSALLADVNPADQFYFMHSYEVCNYTDVLSLSTYANHTFVSAVEKGNFYGVQFHPEKSRAAGLKIFNNFVNHI